jgi:hypothetical protein
MASKAWREATRRQLPPALRISQPHERDAITLKERVDTVWSDLPATTRNQLMEALADGAEFWDLTQWQRVALVQAEEAAIRRAYDAAKPPASFARRAIEAVIAWVFVLVVAFVALAIVGAVFTRELEVSGSIVWAVVATSLVIAIAYAMIFSP